MPTLVPSTTLDNVPGASGPAQSGHLVFAVNSNRWWFFTWQGKLDSGTATSGTTGALNDTTKSWTTNQFLGRTCIITGGTGAGESFIIGNNTATSLPVIDDAGAGTLGTAPNNTSQYEIIESDKVHAYVSSGPDLSTATWSEATGSPTPTIQTASNNTGFGIGVPGGSNNVGGAGQYPTDGRILQIGYANVSGIDVFLLSVQIDSHYFQVTLRGRLTATTTIAWDGVISGTTDNWNDTATGMDCVPQFPQGSTVGYSSTGRWWTMGDQNGRIACGYAANLADPGTANFNENWQSNQGATAPSSFDTGAGDTCQSALIPLASGFMLAVYCAGNTVSPAGAGNATQTGLRFAESASATQWPTTSTGAAVPNLSATTNDPNDWGIVARTNTDIHVVRRNAATTLEHVRYTGHSGSWGAKVNLPTTGLTGHLAGSGVALVSDGASVWCWVIDTDANHSIRYLKWTAANGWDSSWSTLSGPGTEVKNFISAYMRTDGQQIGVVWTANSASPFQVNFAALTFATATGGGGPINPGQTWRNYFWKGLLHPFPATTPGSGVTVLSSTSDPVSGAASGSASGVLSLAQASSGTSSEVGSASGVLALAESASGTGAGVSSGSGALASAVSAAGSSTTVAAGSGVQALVEATSGTAASVSTATGAAALTESLNGTSSGVSTGTGAAAEVVTTSGTSTSVAVGSGVLQALSGAATSGTSQGISSITGVLALVVSAAGTSASPAASSGSLAQSVSTSGTSPSSAAGSGAAVLATSTGGTSTSPATASGSLALVLALAGASAAVGSGSGALQATSGAASRGTSASVSSATGALVLAAALVGTSSGVAQALGAMALAVALSGRVDARSGATGSLGGLAGPGTVQVFLFDAFPAQAFISDAFPTQVFITDIFGGSVGFYVGKAIVLANWGGTVANPTGGFRNSSGTLYDPTTPSIRYRFPGAGVTTVSGGSLVKDAVGLYHLVATPTEDGDAIAVALSADGAYSDPVTFKIEPAPL